LDLPERVAQSHWIVKEVTGQNFTRQKVKLGACIDWMVRGIGQPYLGAARVKLVPEEAEPTQSKRDIIAKRLIEQRSNVSVKETSVMRTTYCDNAMETAAKRIPQAAEGTVTVGRKGSVLT